MQNKFNQNGRSMIEMLGVLAIIGVLSVGGFSLVSKVQENQRINETTDNLTSLARKARPVARDYRAGDLCGAAACTSFTEYLHYGMAYPEGMDYEVVDRTAQFRDRNDVVYSAFHNGVGNSVLFVVSAKNLSEKMCIQLATSNYGSPASSGYMGINIGAASGDVALSSLNTNQKTIGAAVTECGTACSAGNCNIHLGFR